MSEQDVTDVVDNNTTPATPPAPETNVINYNPIFPVMTASVLLDLPIDDMANDILRMATDVENYEGGFSSLFTSLSLSNVGSYSKLEEAIYGVSSSYLQELKYEKNDSKCSIVAWANVMRTGGHQRSLAHPHTQLSGAFIVKSDDRAVPFVFDNPTNIFRMHELQIKNPDDFSPYTSPFFSVQPKANTLMIWPSWLTYNIPKISPGASVPFIFISFTVDFLPPGA